MYANRGLGDWSDLLSDVIKTGTQIYKDSQTPVFNTRPILGVPGGSTVWDQNGNLIRTNYPPGYAAPSNYTLPLAIGAGALVLFMLARRGRK
jgi:hypothetical protein